MTDAHVIARELARYGLQLRKTRAFYQVYSPKMKTVFQGTLSEINRYIATNLVGMNFITGEVECNPYVDDSTQPRKYGRITKRP